MSCESNSREVRAYGANDLILHELLRLKSVPLIPTSDASSYLNPGAAKSILLHEIHHHSYGRISLNELQIICNVEMGHIDNLIREIINDDPSSYQLIGGEIISKIYFQQLAKEINLIVKWDGFATYATLSSRFHLPMEFISQVIRDHICSIIRGTLRNNIIFSENHLQRQCALLRGSCLGTAKPLQISYLSSLTNGMDETAVFKYISDLIQSAEITGSCSAKEYVPQTFQHSQRQAVDAYFTLYGIIEIQKLTSEFGVSGKLIDFIRVSFPGAVQLTSSIISSDHLRSVERELNETVAATAQENQVTDSDVNWNGTGGIPWIHLPSSYPSGLPQLDEDALLNHLYETSIKRSDLIDVMTTEGLYLVNKRFYTWIQKQIYLDCQLVGNTLLNQFKTQIAKSVSISSVSMSSMLQSVNKSQELVEDETGGRGKKGKKGSKSKGLDESELQVPSSAKSGGGKKSESKKKSSKTNQSSNSELSSSQPSVLTALAPYVDDNRLIGLLREWCQPIVDFSEGRVRSDSDSLDEVSSDDSNDLLMPFYVGLWELLRDTSQDHYKAVALRAKDEALQGGSTDRMKREQERDRKFEVMWNELQIAIKGLAALENRGQNENLEVLETIPLHRFLLSTRCAKIVELLTVHCCWECGLEFTCSDLSTSQLDDHPPLAEGEEDTELSGQQDLDHHSTTSSRDSRSHKSKHSLLHPVESVMPFINSDDKQQLQRTLPKETSAIILKFWTLVTSQRHRVWDFVEYLESCISCGALQLVGHKIDKKKERAIAFAMKQTVMDRLRLSSTSEECLPLICTLAMNQVTGAILELPSLSRNAELLVFVLAWFERNEVLTQVERDQLRSLGCLEEGDVDAVLLEEVKGYVLKKK